MTERFTDWLRARNRDAWDAMVGHRFCRDMATDALPEAAFHRYLRYEHAFVRNAISIFAYALAKASTPADQDHLIGVLQALAGEQEAYFARTFEGLGLPAAPLAWSGLPPAARGLGEGVLEIAASSPFPVILSAMLGAEWMYLTWCEAAYAQAPQRAAAADWIGLHVEAGFREQVGWLRRRLDELGPALDPATREACAAAMGRVLELEIAFHDAPYEGA
jgi:thiaminase/transcriptional activator TenA